MTTATMDYTPIRAYEDSWRPQYTFEQVMLLDPDLSKVTFDESVRGFKLDGSNREQMSQLGRALALSHCNLWELLALDDDLPPATYHLSHRSNGRLLEVSIGKITTADDKVIDYAELWELDSDNEFRKHPLMNRCTRYSVLNRVDKTKPVIAYTKYHMLVKMIQDTQITVINSSSESCEWLTDAFRREMAYLSGYAWQDFSANSELV